MIRTRSKTLVINDPLISRVLDSLVCNGKCVYNGKKHSRVSKFLRSSNGRKLIDGGYWGYEWQRTTGHSILSLQHGIGAKKVGNNKFQFTKDIEF